MLGKVKAYYEISKEELKEFFEHMKHLKEGFKKLDRYDRICLSAGLFVLVVFVGICL
jgi:hypothetical protein